MSGVGVTGQAEEPDDSDIWEVSDEQYAYLMMTCPYYHGIGTCRNSCYEEPTCITGGPFEAPFGWTVEELKARAELRRDNERGPV